MALSDIAQNLCNMHNVLKAQDVRLTKMEAVSKELIAKSGASPVKCIIDGASPVKWIIDHAEVQASSPLPPIDCELAEMISEMFPDHEAETKRYINKKRSRPA